MIHYNIIHYITWKNITVTKITVTNKSLNYNFKSKNNRKNIIFMLILWFV